MLNNNLTIDDLRLLQDILTTDWIIDKMCKSDYWKPKLKEIGVIFNKICLTENKLILESKIFDNHVLEYTVYNLRLKSKFYCNKIKKGDISKC